MSVLNLQTVELRQSERITLNRPEALNAWTRQLGEELIRAADDVAADPEVRVIALTVGIGCSLALASDLIVASRSAYFLLAFVNLGLGLGGGASQSLVARVGHARAQERVRSSDFLEGMTSFLQKRPPGFTGR